MRYQLSIIIVLFLMLLSQASCVRTKRPGLRQHQNMKLFE